MSRSLKKGPYIDENLMKKITRFRAAGNTREIIKTWARASSITPEMVGFTIGVHNGRTHVPVLIIEDMVGHKLGEFSLTKKFSRHGGKIQKEIEAAAKQRDIEAAKAAKEAPVAEKK